MLLQQLAAFVDKVIQGKQSGYKGYKLKVTQDSLSEEDIEKMKQEKKAN